MTKHFYFKEFSLFQFQVLQFSQTVLIQTIQLSISTQFSSIWPIDGNFSEASTPGHSGPESDGSEGVLRIRQSSSITGTSPLECVIFRTLI